MCPFLSVKFQFWAHHDWGQNLQSHNQIYRKDGGTPLTSAHVVDPCSFLHTCFTAENGLFHFDYSPPDMRIKGFGFYKGHSLGTALPMQTLPKCQANKETKEHFTGGLLRTEESGQLWGCLRAPTHVFLQNREEQKIPGHTRDLLVQGFGFFNSIIKACYHLCTTPSWSQIFNLHNWHPDTSRCLCGCSLCFHSSPKVAWSEAEN